MVWAIAAALVAILLYRFFDEPSRLAKARCFSALHARRKKNWALAAKFYREAHQAAARLSAPRRSNMESQIEIQWAAVLHRQGQLCEAETLLRRGLAKGECLTSQPELLAQAYLCWGGICSDQGRLLEAEEYYRSALEADESANSLPGMIFDLQRLGGCLARQNRLREAEETFERAIALELRQTREFAAGKGLDIDRYKITPISLASLHFCRGEYEDARKVTCSQLEHWEKQANRPDNIDLGELHLQLARAEERAGHAERAILEYERGAEEFEREWRPGHPKAMAAREAKAALEAALHSKT